MSTPSQNRSVSPAETVAQLCSRGGPASAWSATSQLGSPAYAQGVVAAAERLAVLGTVLVGLERSGRLAEFESICGLDAGKHLRLARRQAMAWDLERDSIIGRLERVGIKPLLLKGAALRLTTYPDPAERSFSDLDLLVRDDEVDSATQALTAAGYDPGPESERALYRANHHHLVFNRPPGFVLELHWALDSEPSEFALDAEVFRTSARVITTKRGIQVHVPSPEHTLLHLAHQNLDGFRLLRRLVDVDRIIGSGDKIDWDMLARDANRMRVQILLALTLQLATRLLGTPIPPGFIERLRLSSSVKAHLAMTDPEQVVLEQLGERRAVEEFLTLWCTPGAGARVRTFFDRIAHDRMKWRHGLTEAPPKNGLPIRLLALAKLGAYQSILYSRALGKQPRVKRKHFWDD
jgi:hypothetical protein